MDKKYHLGALLIGSSIDNLDKDEINEYTLMAVLYMWLLKHDLSRVEAIATAKFVTAGIVDQFRESYWKDNSIDAKVPVILGTIETALYAFRSGKIPKAFLEEAARLAPTFPDGSELP